MTEYTNWKRNVMTGFGIEYLDSPYDKDNVLVNGIG